VSSLKAQVDTPTPWLFEWGKPVAKIPEGGAAGSANGTPEQRPCRQAIPASASAEINTGADKIQSP